jgi:hypothetical protein
MSQLLQAARGVEFWQCLNCGKVRRILPGQVASIFLVPPEFCSEKCRRSFMASGKQREYELSDQMSFGEVSDWAVNE